MRSFPDILANNGGRLFCITTAFVLLLQNRTYNPEAIQPLSSVPPCCKGRPPVVYIQRIPGQMSRVQAANVVHQWCIYSYSLVMNTFNLLCQSMNFFLKLFLHRFYCFLFIRLTTTLTNISISSIRLSAISRVSATRVPSAILLVPFWR